MSTLLVAPVAPHWAEEVWTAKLRRPGCVVTAGWPAAAEPDMVLQVHPMLHSSVISGLARTHLRYCSMIAVRHAVRDIAYLDGRSEGCKLIYHICQF